jgi:toxin ParE1/3/4
MKRFEVRYSERAEADLMTIGRSIEEATGGAVAERFMDRLIAAVETLEFRPHRQRVRAEFGFQVRVLRFRSYMVFYDIIDRTVQIIRVLHGRQNITADLFKN